MSRRQVNILEVVHELLEVTGSPMLVKIFNEHRNDEEALYLALKSYISGVYNDVHDHDDEEGEEGNNKSVHRYIYLNGVVIDVSNISRIELDFDYNPKKNKNNYFIKVVKKYPSPLEEEYIIPFDSEEERDKGYDVLRAKLKLCNIYIV